MEAENTLHCISNSEASNATNPDGSQAWGIQTPPRSEVKPERRMHCKSPGQVKCTLTFQSTSLQLPIPRPRPWTGQPPPCHPCALRLLPPACPAPASDPALWHPHSTASSPQHRCVPGQPSLSHQQPLPSHLPTSVPPTSAGRSEGHPSAACLHPAPSTRATNQMTRKTKR